MGGVEVVKRLLSLRPGLKVVYMSGYAEGDKRDASGDELGRSFLQKPFSTENLISKVREVLDTSSERLG
jgi:DNA-binding NtrC family response regulator